MNGVRAFQEAFLSADTLDPETFSSFDARKVRYEIYWAFYEGSAYRNLHKWATSYRVQFGLYRYIRNIYNPAYRIGDFWRSHLWGGQLDPEAGDGKSVPSALPIITKNDKLRPAISQIWRWSNWQIKKDVTCLWGSVMGDAGLRIIDDTAKGKVYLALTHPGTIKDVTLDIWGNIKGYTLEEQRTDPDKPNNMATYTESATRDGDQVIYKTFRNNTLYSWDGVNSSWSVPYGFIPMVLIKHNDVGLDWGWSELHPIQGKFREADDLASKLSDQIRKMVDAPWFFSGVNRPSDEKKTTGQTRSITNNPEPGREEIPAVYGPAGSDAKPMVANLDIAAAADYIDSILKEIERDYPELNSDIHNVQGDISGRALRINRQPAEVKVLQRRAPYDDALVRAQQMALTIAGYRKLEGFQGFDLGSFDAGALDHTIGERPIFAKDPLDDLEIDKVFWEVAVSAKNAGLPLVAYLEEQGWAPEKIAKIVNSTEYQARVASLEASIQTSNQIKNGEIPPTSRTTNPGKKDNLADPNKPA
jgi:hypothetical protein